MPEERWRTIPEFPLYEISDLGNIYNCRTRDMMKISYTRAGHTKINLTDFSGRRHTRSVALIVAQEFVQPPNFRCDHLIVLDGDLSNVAAYNLAWRPRGFAWEYTRQLKIQQPLHFTNLPVRNIDTGVEYDSIIHCGVVEGLLFKDIWRSTYRGDRIYPHGFAYEIIERV